MTEYLTAAQIADMNLPELPNSRNAVNNFIATEGWRERLDRDGDPLALRQGNGWAYHVSLLPLTAQTHLTATLTDEFETSDEARRAGEWQQFERLSDKAKQKARDRLTMLTAVTKLTRNGVSNVECH